MQPVSGQDHLGPCVPDKGGQEPMSCCCVEVYSLTVFPLTGNGPKFNSQSRLTEGAITDSYKVNIRKFVSWGSEDGVFVWHAQSPGFNPRHHMN